MKKINTLRATVVAAVLATGSAAWATDGYFPHGFGMKSKGMGGAAVAVTDNAFSGINNPAASVWAGNRAEIGVDIFMPKRSAARTAPGFGGMLEGDVKSDGSAFAVPEFAYNKKIDDRMSWGLTVYGNGGMNTEMPGANVMCMNPNTGDPYQGNLLCGQGKLGVDLMQLIVAPTFAYKLDAQHSVGVSPLLVMQQFKATGLDAFTGFSMAPTKVSDTGTDRSTGVGMRLGYLGQLSDTLKFGATYSPKIKMSKFDKYAGLFAGEGSFDIPENYALGINVQVTPAVSVAADYSRINYSGVPSIGNPMSNLMLGNPMGSANGPGFGWSDVNVLKLGVQWQATSTMVLRAGYNQSTNPVKAENITFNILAPGVITQHVTVGGTYALSKDSELTWAYMYAPKNTVTGPSMYNGMMPGASGITETVRMSQQSLGVQYGWKF
ncbi:MULTISPECIES: OmpP1/FadL family transporter [unclassified Limnohabitans]|uniref:OmpP1/FadL family transporter n=1 Tax=unclassified Limnohabitans TaxID=2626134 RepID=UPI000B0C183B|nr:MULTISPECIES: outer membrane protein transport protein [unclassified Limnohabitans]PUE21225.1 long-chain fatty acid transporter [Limnohabitans sp. WS1]